MKTHIVIALAALNIAFTLAAPQNMAEVDASVSAVASVVGENLKGDVGQLESMQNDQMIRTCVNYECKLMSAGDAKALDYSTIKAVFPTTGDAALTKALTPNVGLVMESVKGLDEQRSRLEKLQAEMAALNSMFSKGAQASEAAKGQFEAVMTKGIVAAAPPTKAYAAALPPSKGSYAAAPAKGSSALQMEAAYCPMTMYELGKSQKLYAETNAQLQSANNMNAVLMSEKRNLENQNALLAMGKAKAEELAAANAKYATEQKNRADMLQLALDRANAEKAALEQAKADLETRLVDTQDALANEKATSASLASALADCNDDKQQLEEEKAALINELKDTQEELRLTNRRLEQEQNAHDKTKRDLAATQKELEATEAARQQLEVAKQQLEDELVETKDQLETMTAERDQLQQSLAETTAQLGQCNEEKLQCNVDLAQEKIITAQLNEQLADAMALLDAEKKAREELTALLMSVKETAESLEEEVQKLQLENVQLKQYLMKLKSEQEAALAMAAGCPPTYEKFGLSCYKYVREKTQWKMAQEQCMKDGGNLVSVESRQEQAFLVDYLKRHEARFDDKYLHLGGFDYNANGVFKWLSTKDPVDLGDTFWLDSNPRGMGRRCLAFQTWEMEFFGQWADEYCWAHLPFVCEMHTVG